MFRQAWTRISHPSFNTKLKRRVAIVGIVTTTGALVSYKTRQWRNQHLQELPEWQTLSRTPQHTNRTVQELTRTMERAKLMGKVQDGVSRELEDIRAWHTENGYKGGLVLRELNIPIFTSSTDNNDDDNDDNDSTITDQHHAEFEFLDAMALARRECYYLYYEVKGNGEIKQEIFCRGTTLSVDVLTCLSFWSKYDDDLQCRVHLGFGNHAQHLLKDILPLLAPPLDKRATIEISGHSLGGAVAFLLAIKLKLLGYNVVKLTTVGAPRFVYQDARPRLLKLLPKDTLRIECDLDIVPFLPPFASHLGDKLWMVHNDDEKDDEHDNCSVCFVPFPDFPWTESVWINFRFFPVLTQFAKHHRVRSYINELLKYTGGEKEEAEIEVQAETVSTVSGDGRATSTSTVDTNE